MRKPQNFSDFEKGGTPVKKAICLCLALWLLLLPGCRAGRVPGLNWDPGEMVELALYTGSVPADAQRKTTTDPREIRQAAQALFRLRPQGEAGEEDVLAGGIGVILVFTRAGGAREVIHLGSGGGTLRTQAGFYKLRRPLPEETLWGLVDAPAHPVGEEGLPLVE